MKKTIIIGTLLLFSCFSSCKDNNKKETMVALPQAKQFVSARKESSSTTSNVQGYDFNIKLVLDGSYAGFSKSLTGNYTCNYRRNLDDNSLDFKRTTSGELLFDSTKYIVCRGDSKIVLKYNDEGEFKKGRISQNNIDVDLLNVPFEKFMDSLGESDISQIAKGSSPYSYKARVKLSSSNQYLGPALNMLGSLGPKLKIKNCEFTNLANGIDLNFNMNSDFTKLEGFEFSFNLSFPFAIKGKEGSSSLTLTYSQKLASNPIEIPSDSEYKFQTSDIQTIANKVNNSISTLGQQNSYSIDLTAKNEFDPSWNKLAIVDSYTAKMYKNGTAFNHSYKYKTHTEEDGKETFKYIIGNLSDTTVHHIKVKTLLNEDLGSLNPTPTANTQFTYLTNPLILNTSDIDSIKIAEDTKKSTLTYTVFMNNQSTANIQNKILSYVNSNTEEGVIKAENYFDNNEFNIRKSKYEITYTNNELTNIKCKTKISYAPTGGDYIGYNITLDNLLEVDFNKNLSKAQNYTSPSKAVNVGGLSYLL